MNKVDRALRRAVIEASPARSSIGQRSARSIQLAAAIGLSVFFLVIYGWSNWFTAQRIGVPKLFFEWERSIPFVPLMIVPYMSIDLLFFAAPFLCRDKRELATFSKRIAAAILIATIFFLFFPLRFAFERPVMGGWLGAFFDWFRELDQPYNLLPSLHIALCTILGDIYARHTRGVFRHASNVWFVLIGLSAVLTYQHHLMDVVGGFALGAYCLYFFPERDPRLPVMANPRIGTFYAIGALGVLGLAVLWWPWGAFLLWPAVSLGVTAAAYFGLGPGIFRKEKGRLPWTTWWALGPILLGQKLSRLYYQRECRPWDQLTPGVWIGRTLNSREAAAAVRRGVTAVLDLTAEFSEPAPFREMTYLNIPVLDLTAPTTEQLDEMAAFIAREAATGIVYVHCKIGYSRTAAAAGAFLIRAGIVTEVSEAIDLLRRVRARIIIRPEVIGALRELPSRAERSGVEGPR